MRLSLVISLPSGSLCFPKSLLTHVSCRLLDHMYIIYAHKNAVDFPFCLRQGLTM